jgi:LmbE family N-acetylglucosaminyl deacetylase
MGFSYKRLVNGKVQGFDQLAHLLGTESVSGERWLFVCPHDDDVVVGGGMWMMAAVEAGVDVRLLVVTDGRQGYCTDQQRSTIVEDRRGELFECYEMLGVKGRNIYALGYADGGLFPLRGRRPATGHEPERIAGYFGLQNTFTHYLRRVRAARVFVPGASDYHPDHQIVHSELLISIFHANGKIWPELGEPCELPTVYEMAIYCDFARAPNLELRSDERQFQLKLGAIAVFQSQQQVAQLVRQVREGGPLEYLHETSFDFYSPLNYRELFETG